MVSSSTLRKFKGHLFLFPVVLCGGICMMLLNVDQYGSYPLRRMMLVGNKAPGLAVNGATNQKYLGNVSDQIFVKDQDVDAVTQETVQASNVSQPTPSQIPSVGPSESPSLTQSNAPSTEAPSEISMYAEKGSFHKSYSFHFLGNYFLDSFVAPPDPQGGVYVVMVNYNLAGRAPRASCHFKLDGNDTVTARFQIPRGGEVYKCLVPPSVIDEMEQRESDHHLSLSIQTNDGKEYVDIMAALWPWHNRHIQYQVAVTNMNRDVTCGTSQSKNCFQDWILWHQNYGIQHFFIYDNLSQQNHPWLQAAKTYQDRGILTLINWPHQLWGSFNEDAQRVAMNHAMYAVASRVQWLGYFDVDEFFLPTSLMLSGNPSSRSHEPFSEKAGHLLDTFAQTITNDTSYLSVRVPMRNAQHPDYCFQNNNKTLERTIRLSRCTAFQKDLYGGNAKVFVRVGTDGPRPIKSPHTVQCCHYHSRMANAKGFLSLVHFAKHYGCQFITDQGCERVEALARSPEVQLLEHQLVTLE